MGCPWKLTSSGLRRWNLVVSTPMGWVKGEIVEKAVLVSAINSQHRDLASPGQSPCALLDWNLDVSWIARGGTWSPSQRRRRSWGLQKTP